MVTNKKLKHLDCDVLITKCCDKLVALPKTYLSAVKDFDETVLLENLKQPLIGVAQNDGKAVLLADPKFIPSENIDGGSFKNILFSKGNGVVNRNYNGLIFHVPYENKIALNRAHSSIIRDNYKLIKYRDNNEINLFDLNEDIFEKTDISKLNPKISSSLETSLDNYLINVNSLKWEKGINWKNVDINIINSFY